MRNLLFVFLVGMFFGGCKKNEDNTVTVVPITPSNLTATLISTTQVDLSWTDKSTNEDGFKIQRKTGTGNFADITTVGKDVTNYSDNGLTPNTTYTYRVYATNSAGASLSYTNVVTVTTKQEDPVGLNNGLVGYWPFNGNANDESGNGNDGTVNGATLTTDRFGNMSKAYSFNGSSSFIQCINSGPVGNPTISLSFWLNASNPGVSSQILGWGQSQNTPGAEFRILTQHVITAPGCSSNIAFDTYQSARCFATFYNNTWDNYILVYNSQLGNTVQFSSLYKNGVLLAECYFSSSNSTNILQQFPITFGRDHGINTAYLNGQLDDIRIYNRALTQEEITYLANN